MTTHTTAGNHPTVPVAPPPDRLTRTATGEGPAYWFFDSLAVVRTPAAETSPTIIEVTVAPGGGAPLHVHADLDDSFYLLDGQQPVVGAPMSGEEAQQIARAASSG
jgi:mannose-6-phosphate isomerase-like protein (cupin superfamily)